MNIAHSMIKNTKTATAASLFGKRSAEPDTSNFVRKRQEPYAGSATTGNPDGDEQKSAPDGFATMRLNIMNEIKGLMKKNESKSYNHYCWSHGIGNHDSKSCKHPKPGHVATATSKNKNGGSEYVYKKRNNK